MMKQYAKAEYDQALPCSKILSSLTCHNDLKSMKSLSSSLITIILTLAAGLALLSPACLADSRAVPGYTSSAAYQQLKISGFSVLVHPDVLAHKEQAKAALDELKNQLQKIKAVLPEAIYVKLQNVKIWLEWEAKPQGAAEFHPSRTWLQENGYNPEKAGAIEIANVSNFVSWSRADQPWMLMHELVHAYHFGHLGEDYADIKAAFSHAQQLKLYEAVAYIHGGKQRAYALNNEKEYFAELSEAYLGQNDFYPFKRDDLLTYDPVGYALMVKVWGKPKTP